jgi:hypothetical protein
VRGFSVVDLGGNSLRVSPAGDSEVDEQPASGLTFASPTRCSGFLVDRAERR